ncbi:agamous-like MADS-box protein AGL29 [Carica papaya]|uniref:agamous-like MADS-box protein AGL29 n=1 Tax=Carica papaya TaxID=3649 RepID=UPI000B8CE3C5|nr:agamous-like MADS-box protein AGL29 [Carica papaya]
MGRRKIEMKVVKDSSSRQVTFSKRRTGLFKKANELVTLCGAEVVVVVFSPGGKPYSFGHPSVDTITRRFLDNDTSATTDVSNDGGIEKLNRQLNDLNRQIAAEKKRGDMLEKSLRESGATQFMKSVSKVNKMDELVYLKALANNVRGNVIERINELEASDALLLLSNTIPANHDNGKL